MNEFNGNESESRVSNGAVRKDRSFRCLGGDEQGDVCDHVVRHGRPPLVMQSAGVPRGPASTVTPCFTPGTQIATPQGERAVERLAVGDWVTTRDNGRQQIRWIGRRELSWGMLQANQHLKPVLIPRGSLGDDLPEHDMMVSPNHRMLVASDLTQLYFDEHEVLVAAKHLYGAGGIRRVDRAGITYLHLLFDRHQVIMANGAWTESFQPDDRTLKGLGNAQRNEIFENFPDLATAAGVAAYTPARWTVRGALGRLFAD